MDKVYIVTSGSYSNYTIESVFSTRDKAEEWIKKIGEEDDYYFSEYGIEEYRIDVPREEWYMSMVRMTRDGKVEEVKEVRRDDTGFYAFDVNHNIIIMVNTLDENRAIKRANEIRTQMIAMNLYPTEEELDVLTSKNRQELFTNIRKLFVEKD